MFTAPQSLELLCDSLLHPLGLGLIQRGALKLAVANFHLEPVPFLGALGKCAPRHDHLLFTVADEKYCQAFLEPVNYRFHHCTVNGTSLVSELPLMVQLTTIRQVPGVVRDPTFQVQDTLPWPSAVLGPSPAALLAPDL
jgi:hypothetical protein